MFVALHLPPLAGTLAGSRDARVLQLLQGLEARGLVTPALFDALAASFPNRRTDLLDAMVELGLRDPPHTHFPADRLRALEAEALRHGLHRGTALAVLRASGSPVADHVPDTGTDAAAWLRLSLAAANRLVDDGPRALAFWLDWAVEHADPTRGAAIFEAARDDLALLRLEGVTPAAQRALERIVDRVAGFVSIEAYIARIAQVKRAVGCVLVDGRETGTAFLVAPDLAITANHVLSEGEGHVGLDRIALRFDEGGRRVHTVLELLAHRPHAAVDLVPDPKPGPPAAHELDYALLRLATRAGDDVVDGSPRGFLRAPVGEAYPFPENSGLAIVQHPDGRPVTLAMASPAVVHLDAGGRRVRYRINTEPGSSGAPVLDLAWNLVALHHAGDPDPSRVALYNQGIPIALILADLPDGLREELRRA